ncbi:hypothetical protein E2C01_014065 [Portunus trituberculatus]|uniref:Uncharacterized protein n=1 Tax=Portunus trituberculatus TaxID=210409 RepID=A0A5B7DHU7_PORTR|nr:hypothetical protein [Portunus trituberculatus]
MCVARAAGRMGVMVVCVVEMVVVVMVRADTLHHAPRPDMTDGVLSRYPGQDDYITSLSYELLYPASLKLDIAGLALWSDPCLFLCFVLPPVLLGSEGRKYSRATLPLDAVTSRGEYYKSSGVYSAARGAVWTLVSP